MVINHTYTNKNTIVTICDAKVKKYTEYEYYVDGDYSGNDLNGPLFKI